MGLARRAATGACAALVGGWLALAPSAPAPAEEVLIAPEVCPPTASDLIVGDARGLCATAATAIGTQATAAGAVRALPSRLRCRVPPGDPGSGEVARGDDGSVTGAGASILLTERDERNCDTLVSAGASGSHQTLYFPRGSLRLNFPSDATYDPTLPIGILTTGPGVELMTLRSGSHLLQRGRDLVPYLSTSGLTLLATHVLEVASNDTNSNESDDAYAAVAFRFYKPSARDSDRTYDYRELYGTGSAHGGNLLRRLTEARLRNRLVSPPSGQTFVEWAPRGTKTLDSGSETITVTLTSVAPGIQASVSHSFTIRPHKYGPLYIDPNTRFDAGWTTSSGLGCCDYVGLGAGSEFRYKPANGYAKRVQVRICWTDELGITGSCKWGAEAG